MRYYVTADVHGFCTPFLRALTEAGYFADEGEKTIVICGDLFDRGDEAAELQRFVVSRMLLGRIVLIRGNHEDLFEAFCTEDGGRPYAFHLENGTWKTALTLTQTPVSAALQRPYLLARACRSIPLFTSILPAMLDYYETAHYVFVHGWIPCRRGTQGVLFDENWREASPEAWAEARWRNGMDCAADGATEEGKTVVCGHIHASYGHAVFEHRGSEFGPDADFSPYSAPGILALDACTVRSGGVNVIVLEDDPLPERLDDSRRAA